MIAHSSACSRRPCMLSAPGGTLMAGLNQSQVAIEIDAIEVFEERMTSNDPNATAAESAIQQIGTEFRRLRALRGERLEDIAAYLDIKATYLFGIEQGDLSVVPSKREAKAMVRSYANYLGLDGEGIIGSYGSDHQPAWMATSAAGAQDVSRMARSNIGDHSLDRRRARHPRRLVLDRRRQSLRSDYAAGYRLTVSTMRTLPRSRTTPG